MGSSHAPGVHSTSTWDSGTPHRAKASCAPARSRRVMRSLNRLTATATRTPRPSGAPRTASAPGRVGPPSSSRWRVTPLLDGQQVAQFVTLRRQVAVILRVGRHFDRYALDDLDAVALEPDALGRIVRQQTDAPQSQIDEDLCADPVVARIRREAEEFVGLDRVASGVLQRIGADLVGQPDPASFLPDVDERAPLRPRDRGERGPELLAAVTAQRAE